MTSSLTIRARSQALDAPDTPVLVPTQPDEVVWVLDAKGVTLAVDDRVHDLIGYWPDEVLDAGEALWWRRIHPRDRVRMRDEFEALFSIARAFEVEYRFRRRDGRWTWLDARAVALTRADAGFCAHVVVRSAAERRKAETRCRRALDGFRMICATAPVVVARRDARRDFGLSFVGSNVRALLGHSPAEVLRASAFLGKIVHPDDRAIVHASVRRAAARGSSSCEFRALHKTRGYVWLREETHSVREAGLPASGGLVSYWSSVGRERRQNEELRRLEAALHVLEARAADALAVCVGRRVVQANAAFARAVGRELGSVVGRDVLDLACRTDRGAVLALLQDPLVSAPTLVDVRWLKDPGDSTLLRCASLPVSHEGKPAMLLIGLAAV